MQTQTVSKRETANFTNQNIYVGFDVHLKSWKAANVRGTFERDSSEGL